MEEPPPPPDTVAVLPELLEEYPDVLPEEAVLLPEEEVLRLWQNSQIVAVTPYTITNYEEFCHCLHDVHTHGYALDNEENELGVRCIAAALPDHTGTARYAFSISAPVGRMDDQRILELSRFVLNTKNELMKLFF